MSQNFKCFIILLVIFHFLPTKSSKVSTLLHHLFDRQQCVYIITSKLNHTTNIKGFNKFPVYIVDNAKFRNDRFNLRYECVETGYIVLFEDYKDMFTNFTIFLPHIRTVFIYDEIFEQFVRDSLTGGLYQAMDIILISYSKHLERNSNAHYNSPFVETINSNELNITKIEWFNWNKTLNEDDLSGSFSTEVKLIFKESIKVLYFDFPPYILTKNASVTGLEHVILELVTKDWPIEYIKYPLFSWEAMLDDLEEKKGDICIAANYEMNVIRKHVNFVPSMQLALTFLIPDAQLLPPETYVFQALADSTWGLILCVFVLMALLIKLVSKYNEGRSIDNAFMISLSYLTMNSTKRRARTYFLKGVLLVWSLTCLLFNTTYSAGFTSVENVPRTTRPIRTFKDIVETKTTCYIYDVFTISALQAHGSVDQCKLAETVKLHRIEQFGREPTPGLCFNADVLLNRFLSVPYKLTVDNMIDLKLLQDNYLMTNIVYGVTLRSPYYLPLADGVNKLIEHGIIEYLVMSAFDTDLHSLESFWKNRWSYSKYEAAPIIFKDIQGAFILLGIGLVLATIAFCVEKYSYKTDN